jgi:hypothetical protein
VRECEDYNCRFATVGIQEEDTRSGLEIYAGKIRNRRLCSLCAVEYIDTDGADMIRCLDCADLANKRDRTDFTSDVQPP